MSKVETILWMILAAFTVVIPNAYKEFTVAVLFLLALSYTISGANNDLNRTFIWMWLLSVLISLAYSMVGYINGAPIEAFYQILIIYILSPMLWALALNGAIKTYGINTIVNSFIIMTVLCIVSQAYFFWAFVNLGPESVELLAGNPNLDFSNNSSAAVMFVFGSMIFLYGGLLASPEVIKSQAIRYSILLLSLVSTFTSGRKALILSLGVALLVRFSISAVSSSRNLLLASINVIVAIAFLFFADWILYSNYQIEIFLTVDGLLDDLTSGGGAGRQDYIPLLYYGAIDNYFLGAGHGINVAYTVSEEYPWRYEVVGLATLFRVGIFGLFIYALPFLVSIIKSLRFWHLGLLNSHEKYLAAALVCAMVGANTNPYIEAVSFQWMYVLPCLYFLGLKRLGNPTPRYISGKQVNSTAQSSFRYNT